MNNARLKLHKEIRLALYPSYKAAFRLRTTFKIDVHVSLLVHL